MQVDWHSYDGLNRSNIERYVPAVGGVYVFWVKLTSGDWRCFYVGRCGDLERRLLEHVSDDEPNACIRKHVSDHHCGFSYAQVGREEDRRGIEKHLYDQYSSPECNDLDPGGSASSVNLPDPPS